MEHKWKVLISVMFGIFMIILDATIVNIAFPTLRLEFGASLTQAQWVLSIYVLALGVTTPVSGFLADRFGIKRMYLLGLAIFVLGSFLCGIAPSLGLLIAARALQGFGGGIAQPLGPAQLYRAFPPHEQGTALGLLGIALVVAPALGPILGGWLVGIGLWRVIFFVNVPIGILGVFLGSRFLLDYRVDRRPVFDPLGLVTAVIGFGAVLVAASIAENYGWLGTFTLLALGLGMVVLVVHAIIELYRGERTDDDLAPVRQPGLPERQPGGLRRHRGVVRGGIPDADLFANLPRPHRPGSRRHSAGGGGHLGLCHAAGRPAVRQNRPACHHGDRFFDLMCQHLAAGPSLQGTTPISYIVFLLALRGLAVGLTLQTSFVTALSSIPLNLLPRGSSLLNSTRFVVQAVSVAALATILVGYLSPPVKAQQDQMQNSTAVLTTPFGVCETPGVAAQDNLPPGTTTTLAALPAQEAQAAKNKIVAGLQQACTRKHAGFRRGLPADLLRLDRRAAAGGFPAGLAGQVGRARLDPGDGSRRALALCNLF